MLDCPEEIGILDKEGLEPLTFVNNFQRAYRFVGLNEELEP